MACVDDRSMTFVPPPPPTYRGPADIDENTETPDVDADRRGTPSTDKIRERDFRTRSCFGSRGQIEQALSSTL
jgi:hypothetical protein